MPTFVSKMFWDKATKGLVPLPEGGRLRRGLEFSKTLDEEGLKAANLREALAVCHSGIGPASVGAEADNDEAPLKAEKEKLRGAIKLMAMGR